MPELHVWPAGHRRPHPPQLFGSVNQFVQSGPGAESGQQPTPNAAHASGSHVVQNGGITSGSAWNTQFCPLGQRTLHPPQLLGSANQFVQSGPGAESGQQPTPNPAQSDGLQLVQKGPVNTGSAWVTQFCPPGQAWPQPPQFAGSENHAVHVSAGAVAGQQIVPKAPHAVGSQRVQYGSMPTSKSWRQR